MTRNKTIRINRS